MSNTFGYLYDCASTTEVARRRDAALPLLHA
jgi:hypothetical protein